MPTGGNCSAKYANIPDYDHQPKLTSSIVFPCCKSLLWLPISTVCLPFFLVGLCVWGLPPTIPVCSRIFRYFTAVFTEGKSEDDIPFLNRVRIFVLLLNVVVKVPVNGVCWFLDELLYPNYHGVDIKEPVFFLTAPRSGSVQLWQYLEDDKENFIIPTVAEAVIPYIWYWKLFIPTLARLGIKQQRNNNVAKMFGVEANKRFNGFNFSKAATWDGLVRMWHVNVFSLFLGSSLMKWGYSYANLQEPIDEKFHGSFLSFTRCVVKKVIYLRGKPKQRMVLKVHFLQAAEALKQEYPKSKFFMVVRQPLDRFQSFINMLKVFCADGIYGRVWGLFPPSWRVICDYAISTQIPYCEQEMSFYQDDQENKLVIPFTMYVNNLSATLQHIYSFCNIPIPDHVVSRAIKLQNTSHDRTKLRASYNPDFNRSLASLGVDEEKVKEHLTEYIEWINQLDNYKKFN